MVVENAANVLDPQTELARQGQAQEVLYRAVLQVLEGHQLLRRELRQTDSLSFLGEEERQRIQAAIGQFRILPEDKQRQQPALRHAIGKLEAIVGDYAPAARDFQAVAGSIEEPKARAEALGNAYLAALEQPDWPTAMTALLEATKLDPERWAPFPVKEYEPQRILGADAFGVVFRCFQRNSGKTFVIRALRTDDLDRGVDDLFNRARELNKLQHPVLLITRACDYCRPETKSRPYLVVDHFLGLPLDRHVEKEGPLPPADFLAILRLVAQGLQAAHSHGIMHGQVRPANVLVQRDDAGWKVKLTNFGLVFKPNVLQTLGRPGGVQTLTLRSASIAAVLEYAAPEQTGRLAGVYPGTFSDIYGFGKTCCHALFRNTKLTPQQRQSVPGPLAEMLEHCMQEMPEKRPADFDAVLARLSQFKFGSTPGAAVRAPAGAAVPPNRTSAVRSADRETAGAAAGVSARPSQAAAISSRAQPPGRSSQASSGPRSPAGSSTDDAPARSTWWPWMLGGFGLVAVIAVISFCVLLVVVLAKKPSGEPEAARPPSSKSTAAPRATSRSGDPDEVASLTGHALSVMSVAFNPSGSRLLSGGSDGSLLLWDIDNARILQHFLGLQSPVLSLAFSSDGRYSLSGCQDRNVRLWEADVGTPKRTLSGPTAPVVAVAFERDGGRAYACDRNGNLRGWDLQTGRDVLNLNTGGDRAVAFSADGRLALTGGSDRVFRIWDLNNGRETRRWLGGQAVNVTALALAPDGRHAFSAGDDRVLRIWDVDGGRQLTSRDGPDVQEITCLACAENGDFVLSGDREGNLRLWKADTVTLAKRFRGHGFRITSVAFSPDGHRAVSSGYDQTIRVWKLPE